MTLTPQKVLHHWPRVQEHYPASHRTLSQAASSFRRGQSHQGKGRPHQSHSWLRASGSQSPGAGGHAAISAEHSVQGEGIHHIHSVQDGQVIFHITLPSMYWRMNDARMPCLAPSEPVAWKIMFDIEDKIFIKSDVSWISANQNALSRTYQLDVWFQE